MVIPEKKGDFVEIEIFAKKISLKYEF